MIHPIILYNSEILRTRSNSIDLTTANPNEVRTMIDDMFETMHRAHGIGLSAIQIGVPIRAFVIEAHIKEENFHLRETFINPKIIDENKKTIYLTEGCLSLPNIAALVERPETIKLEYYNYKLEKITQEFDGIAARIIQHEFDHLNGVLFIDKLETMWRTMLEDQLDQIINKKNIPEYLYK